MPQRSPNGYLSLSQDEWRRAGKAKEELRQNNRPGWLHESAANLALPHLTHYCLVGL